MLMPLAVSVDEAAEMIGCSKSKLYAVIASGELRARKQGRRTLLEVAEIQRYLAELPLF